MMTRSGFSRSITGGYQRTPQDTSGIAAMGRHGDSMLAHVNPEEAALLKARGGAGTTNPATGLPEFYAEGDTDAPGSGGQGIGGVGNEGAGVGSQDGGGGSGPGTDSYSGFMASQGFYPGLNPEMGPGARPGRERIEQAQPSGFQSGFANVVSAALPGFSVEARPNYIEGKPELATSFNPIGFAQSFMGPLGFNPIGDAMAPDWASMEIGAVPFGDPEHEKPGQGSQEGGGVDRAADWQDMSRQLVQSVLRQPEQQSALPPPAPQRTYTPFTGDATTYGQPGGPAGHRYFG